MPGVSDRTLDGEEGQIPVVKKRRIRRGGLVGARTARLMGVAEVLPHGHQSDLLRWDLLPLGLGQELQRLS